MLSFVVSASTGALACDAGGACTEIGCEHRAIVTLPAGTVDGPYDLFIEDATRMSSARCNDPGSPEAMDSPPGLQCDASGFELTGHPLANARSVRITIIDPETDEVLVEQVEVFLDVAETLQPNGEGCEPTCFVRHGQLVDPRPV